jgi:TonB-linked SusC/RagA family outer membrane protein
MGPDRLRRPSTPGGWILHGICGPDAVPPFMEVMVNRLARCLAGAVFVLVLAVPAAAQTGSITGQVLDRATRQPMVGVQVYLDGTSIGGLTQENGRFLIQNVSPGTYNVVAQYIGYANGRHDNVRVASSETTVIDFELATQALTLEEVVVTGSVDPVAGIKLPYTVGKVTKEMMPIPTVAAGTAIQGKIAGARVVRGSGQPGDDATIVLRGVTSLEKDNDPLIVVDGVILGYSNLSDIDAADIESIEVVKGAAAASLYGSRASAGVIQITTARGRNVGLNDTRFTVSTEYGRNQMVLREDFITAHHHYRVGSNGYVDAQGNPVSKDRRVAEADLIADNAYPGPIYNQVERFFDPGTYLRSSVSIAQNTRATNFMASLNFQDNAGVVPNNDGAQLYGVRLNLDHRLRSDLNFSVSSYYSRFNSDEFGGGNIFYDLMFMPPDVDLNTPNEDGEPYLIRPDPFTLQENPLYNIWKVDDDNKRSRFTGSGVLRYSPANWFSVEGNFSFDRSDRHTNEFTPKGTKSLSSVSNGAVARNYDLTQAINGGVRASLLHSIGDLTLRTTGQYSVEQETNDSRDAEGNTLSVVGVPDVDVGINAESGSSFEEVRSVGYYLITGLDYAGKYILDGLVRRDGSSLFGPDNRWATYYRLSGAWRMAQEPWWISDALTEFKLRAAIGTAGARPEFEDRFEVWDVSGSGNISKGTLGNSQLKPEFSREIEAGIDMIVNNRYSLQLTHARNKVTDLLLEIPLAGLFGYGTQWQNAGSIESTTWEGTLEASLIQSPTTNWTVGLVADRTRSTITEFDRGCYRTQSIFYYCAGVEFGTIFGYKFLDSPSELAVVHAGSQGAFQLNDDGLLVPVGAGNTFRDGIAKNLWGTRVNIDGVDYDWGLPILLKDSTGGDALVPIGDGNPDFNVGLSSNLTWRGFNLYGLLDAKVGGDVFSETRQWAYRDNTHADYDQFGKPEELKKPVTYYQRLYLANANTSWFVDDGTYLKLREVALQYSFRGDQLERLLGGLGMERLTIGVVGRNLLTFTDYFGFDPEVGSAEQPFDDFNYPNFRTFTLKFDVEF